MNNKLEVIGIDHGWSMMKTISQVFVTGVKEITTTPALFGDVLEYEGKFYKVGTVRQEVKDTKVEDDSFYLLTLAAVAKELKRRGLAEAKVFLAVGLPLTRFGAEKNDFIKYLTKNKRVSFKYENEPYHIEIDDVAVFPQCYAAVVDKIPTMAKKTLIVDIGSWTIDIMPVINKSPDESKCVTIPKGLITCMRSINEQCVRQLNGEVDESEIQNIMRYGRSDIDDEYFAIIKAEIEDFVDKVYNSIREFGYNLKTTPIVFVGGGAVVMKNFGSHDAKNISYPVMEGTTSKVLNAGIGHIEETAGIGESGNCVLCGHNGSRYGTFFTPLNQISIGDEVMITDKNGLRHIYEVTETEIVNPYDNSIKTQGNEKELTLFTCSQKGTMRFVVRCIYKEAVMDE